MSNYTLQNLIDNIIKRTGNFRAPSWWVHQLFTKIADEIASLHSNFRALNKTLSAKFKATQETVNNLRETIPYFTVTSQNGEPFDFNYEANYHQYNLHGSASYDIPCVFGFKFFGGSSEFSLETRNICYAPWAMLQNGYPTLGWPDKLVSLSLNSSFFQAFNGLPFTFKGCTDLKTFYTGGSANAVGSLLNSAHTKTINMFSGCKSLSSISFAGSDSSNVDNMSNMFYECESLAQLNLKSLDTHNVTTMGAMFYGCKSISKLDLSNFNTSNVAQFNNMFYGCTNLVDLNLSGWVLSAKILAGMFVGCTALTTVTGPISGITKSLSLSDSPLTAASAMVFINGLAEISTRQTLTLKSSTYNLLTAEQTAIATSKGWTIASSN